MKELKKSTRREPVSRKKNTAEKKEQTAKKSTKKNTGKEIKKENKKDTGISDRKCGHNDPVCDHYPVSGIKYIGNFIK